MIEISSYIKKIMSGDNKAIARAISLIENEANGYEELLKSLPLKSTPIIGITGPPGAGKSTITDLLIGEFIKDGKKIAVLCVDPSSPFNRGALLGDRVRMSKWYNNADVFIRSFATRGSLGGLHPKIIEITELIKAAPFDYIIIETVGVGQNEVEIAGLADATVVVLVPEAGDEIQTMKAGLMEIADIFVVNKCDRPGADKFVMDLQHMLMPVNKNNNEVPVLKTIATEKIGIEELREAIKKKLTVTNNRKNSLIAERAYQLIIHQRMKNINKEDLKAKIEQALKQDGFNLYKFIEAYY
jgi:LAO/AO transport system kinase